MPLATRRKFEYDAFPVTTTVTGVGTVAAATGSLIAMEHPASSTSEHSAAHVTRRSPTKLASTAAAPGVTGSPPGVACSRRYEAERAPTCRPRPAFATPGVMPLSAGCAHRLPRRRRPRGGAD